MAAANISNLKKVDHPMMEQQSSASSNGHFSPYAKSLENAFRLELHVEGIHCAKCIWAIESVLQKEPDILEARVNMSTAKLTLRWQGAVARADHLAALVEKLGYKVTPIASNSAPPSSEASQLLRYMAIAGFAMGNLMLISVALWSSDISVMGLATRELMHWVSALIALPTIAYAGQPFFTSAWGALSSKQTNMDVPISLAVILASFMSLFETIHGGEHAYFDSAVMLLFFLLIGRWLDAKARGKAREHATELLALLSGTATLIEGEQHRVIAINDLKAGDIVLIAAGEKVPSDAITISGSSEIDSSLVTGESLPKTVAKEDILYGGTINLSAPLTCKILQPSENSLLAEVIRLMEKAEQARARYVRLADYAAKLYTPVVHLLAAGAFLGWFVVGGVAWQNALLIAITTLIITCPCALGLAVPAVQVLAISWLMKRGILVKSADALEKLTQIDTVIFDKTGTLTMGKPILQSHSGNAELLQIAATLADHSKHPLSQAVSEFCTANRLLANDITEIPGKGISGIIDGKTYFLGKLAAASDSDAMTIGLYTEDKEINRFIFSDRLRDDAAATIAAFKAHHIHTELLSGDRKAVAEAVAKQLDIETVQAEVLPSDKLNSIKTLQDAGHYCFMIGDGLNDAPALAAAHASMSPASGMDITQNTADMVFQGNSLKATYLSWKMALFSTKLVKQNFALAILYNCFAIPLALMGMVTPLIAAIAMSSSSLIVIGNSFRIRLLKED